MRLIRFSRSRRRGVAVVEFALLLPMIMILLLGVLEVGRAIDVQQIMSNAAREGARQASTGQLTDSQVQQVVMQYLQNAGYPTSHAVVVVDDLNSPGTDVTQAQQLDPVKVTVSIPFTDVRWAALNYFYTPSTTINAQATWNSVKDQPFPNAASVPDGS